MTAPILSVEQLDPASLLVDVNVRADTTLDKEFLASVRELGVLVPIVAVRTTDGRVRVRYGHRRTLAAAQTGHAVVPVVIVGDEDADEAARIVSQWHENEYRSGMTTADKLAAVEQLSLLGLSAAQIVKRTKARKQDVAQALAAVASPMAKGAADRYGFLTLDAASAIAEFETDTSTVKALVTAAQKGDGDFRHVLQRSRDDREEANQVAALSEQFTSAGIRIIDQPGYGETGVKALADLVTQAGSPLDPDEHSTCPGHAVYLARTWQGIAATLVCDNWKAHEHQDRHRNRTSTQTDDRTKAQRQDTIARNKEWRSATIVRQEWLAGLLARKTPPKGAATYVATEIALGSHPLRRAMQRAHELAASLLRIDASHPGQSIAALCQSSTDSRVQVITLAMVLAAVEDSTDVFTWRNRTDVVARYFAFLAANDYTLTEVEQIAAATAPKRRRPQRPAPAADVPTTETPADDTAREPRPVEAGPGAEAAA